MSELIREAAGEQDYGAFAQLISEYVAWLRSRYKEDTWFITEVLDRQSLSSELESLPTVCVAAVFPPWRWAANVDV